VIKSRCLRWEGRVRTVDVTKRQIFLLENLKRRNHSEDLGIDGDNIRMDLRKMGWEGVDWIHLAQDRDQWRAVVNAVMNLPHR